MKRFLAVILASLVLLALTAGCGAAQTTPTATEAPVVAPVEEAAAPAEAPTPEPTEEPAPAEPVYARMITEIPVDADLDTIINLENRNCKNITSVKPVLDPDTYSAYSKAVTKMKKEKTLEAAEAAVAARAAILQNDDAEERIWYLWDDGAMPMADGENLSAEQIDESQMFGYGFTPLVVAYLLDDPASAKGNIVACSGGGMLVWANGAEGFPAAGVFNELGYNFFLLQRRVGPYCNEDIFMDYQRAVRLVRYHAAHDGYGHADMIAGVGWSGGAGTLMGAVNNLYGHVLPTIYDTDYVPDEFDAISADLDVAMPIYGGHLETDSGNTNLPAFYMCVGSEDGELPTRMTALRDAAIAAGVPAELYIVEGAQHGFGVGLPPATGQAPGTELWPAQADAFMQANYGHQSKYAAAPAIELSEAPGEYTKAKCFYGYYILQDSYVTFAMNEEETRFFVKFYTFASSKTMVLGGSVDGGVCTVDVSYNGLFGEDVQLMYEDALADPAPWSAIVRGR